MRLFIFMFCFMANVFAQDIYSVNEKGIGGKDFPMSELKGKVVLIVNIASQCGYTYQLSDLETLYQKYKSKGLVVLGVPTNDFGGQTPENDKDMAQFCSKKYNVTFPLLAKKTVQGKEKRELYKLLTEKSPGKLKGEIAWNFVKFLVNKNGEVVGRYSSDVKPNDKELISKIESLL